MWVRKLGKKKTTSLPVPTAKPEADPFRVVFEQMVTTYESLTPGQRKFWAAGQEMTIMNEKGEYCHYTIALKREDIIPTAGDVSSQSEDKKNKSQKSALSKTAGHPKRHSK